LDLHTIIVTYNGSKWIDTCLSSLRHSSCPSKVHVVDNASTDDTVNLIRNGFPEVDLIQSTVNLGFGQANNVGIRRALDQGATHIFLLNQDAWVHTGTLAALLDALERVPGTGIISPLHLEGTGKRLDHYFRTYLSRSQVDPLLEDVLLGSAAPSVTTIQTEFVNAAAWLLPRSCLLSAGGFDPIFFHYGEDGHYCDKVLQRGMSIRIHTGSTICHDREQRLLKGVLDEQALQKKEWMNYLIHACDIRDKRPLGFFLRRSVGHVFRAFESLFNGRPRQAGRSLILACKTLSSIPSILACRKRSLTADISLNAAAAALLR
jgi:GT2 family glycosyltransferase